MAVLLARLEAGAVARLQDLLARIGDQHDFAFQHIDELVFFQMPVALAGPDAGFEPQKVDAELGQPRDVAQLAALARAARLVIGRRIVSAHTDGLVAGIDTFGHGSSLHKQETSLDRLLARTPAAVLSDQPCAGGRPALILGPL